MTPPSLTPSSRADRLDELEADRFDLVIVGGGITGAGIARDAAARGLRVALLEADDFAAGTSSRSSKLIHGGLRYLASGEVDLVRKTARERTAVHAMAPHLAEPCWMVVPARNWASVTKFRAGIGTYEKLGGIDDADRHEVWKGEEITAHEPHLRTDPYDYAVAYREYLTDDSRLVLAVLRAAVEFGAVVANRAPVVDVVRVGDRVEGVVVRDTATDREAVVRGDVVVNAAGPWVESIARMEQDPPETLLHLSKGVHAVVPRDRFPANHLVIANTPDKRSIFVIPRGDVVYFGTTDTSYHGDRPLWPEIERSDIEYLLDPMTKYFDIDPLGTDDVIAAWAGVRPLIAQQGKEAKEMSRKDEVTVGSGGMISIAGGKLTGFRKLAEEVMDVVAKQLGRRLPEGPGTAVVPGGGATMSGDDPLGIRLRRMYGSEAADVLALGSAPLVDGEPVVAGEVDWAIDVEAATTLVDVVYRRTRLAWYVPARRTELAAAAAARMAARLDWSEETEAAELAAVEAMFADELSFKEH
ncbi:MAG: glycerol-3-phosphate dehydrogenase/oxidase [Acidimicrobiales bacterium]|jgi:glycerol-3-phosphate dehydrogenase|nr:glycerol-3-phosphate dehydrogenase/oxidase [Acidimicrobiales bacterium]